MNGSNDDIIISSTFSSSNFSYEIFFELSLSIFIESDLSSFLGLCPVFGLVGGGGVPVFDLYVWNALLLKVFIGLQKMRFTLPWVPAYRFLTTYNFNFWRYILVLLLWFYMEETIWIFIGLNFLFVILSFFFFFPTVS